MPFVKRSTTYMKHNYVDYTLPNMTGYSSPEGSISQNIHDNDYTSARYLMFWGRDWYFNTKYPTGTVYNIYQFSQPLKPDTYRVTMNGYTQNNTSVTARIYVQYTDDTEEYLEEKVIYTTTVYWDFSFTATKPIKRIGFHGVANPWNSINTVCTLRNFTLTSTTGNLQKDLGMITGTEDDYDYAIPSYKMYQLVKGERSYYKYGNEIDANVVGSFARIDKGVARGFSTSNYLNFNEYFRPENNPWERVFCITTGSSFSDHLPIDTVCPSSTNANSNYMGIEVLVMSDKKLHFWGSSTVSSFNIANNVSGITELEPSTTYYVKTLFDGSSYKVLLSPTGEFNGEETTEIDIASTLVIWQGNTLYDSIGVVGGSINLSFNGSIDLSKSYININGERWWSGDRYVKMGSWMEGTVVSGFSSSNYLQLPNTFNPENKTWEICLSITTGSNFSLRNFFLGNTIDHTGNFGGVISEVRTDGKFGLFLGNSNQWNIIEAASGSHTVLLNTKYLIKIEFIGSFYLFKYSLDNGKTWITDITVESSEKIKETTLCLGALANSLYHTGSIDLSKSYIKINDKMWWNGTKAYQVNLNGDDVIEDWKQPVLTSNTQYGLVSSTAMYSSDVQPYRAFDGKVDASNKFLTNSSGGGNVTWQLPKPIKIESFDLYQTTETSYLYRFPRAVILEGSNDGINFNQVASALSGSYTQPASGGHVTVTADTPDYYKYYKWTFGSGFSTADYVAFGCIKINAQILEQVGSDTYDFYETRFLSYVPILNNKLY